MQKDEDPLERQVIRLLGHVNELVVDPELALGASDPAQPDSWSKRSACWCNASRSRPATVTVPSFGWPTPSRSSSRNLQRLWSANQKSDLQIYLTYADHLRFRKQRDRCLEVIERGAEQPAAAKPANSIPVMGLHAVAVEMALSKSGRGGAL